VVLTFEPVDESTCEYSNDELKNIEQRTSVWYCSFLNFLNLSIFSVSCLTSQNTSINKLSECQTFIQQETLDYLTNKAFERYKPNFYTTEIALNGN